tara:strand:- start:209 stop:688 length:480 start_codon:yes stop_codon:yes gene_type:complete
MKKVILVLLLSMTFMSPTEIKAQEGFIGEVRMFAGTFAPRGWALCQGQLLPISSNSALFSILGTTYGGDGRTTFALPDLRGRVPMGVGRGNGLTSRNLGQKVGTETTSLSLVNIPLNVNGGKTINVPPLALPGNTESNMQPSTVIHFIICLNGIYPPRN